MIRSFHTMPIRRRLVAGALMLSLIGTGIASLAIVSDTLNVTSNISSISVDIQGSTNDGGAYTQAVTLDWLVQTGAQYNKPVLIKNFGNVDTTLSFSGSATGTTSIRNAQFALFEVAAPTASTCPATGSAATGTVKTAGGATVGTPTFLAGSAGQVTVTAGASKYICLSINGLTVAAGDSAVQTLVITSASA
jgi:hypothetical protein